MKSNTTDSHRSKQSQGITCPSPSLSSSSYLQAGLLVGRQVLLRSLLLRLLSCTRLSSQNSLPLLPFQPLLLFFRSLILWLLWLMGLASRRSTSRRRIEGSQALLLFLRGGGGCGRRVELVQRAFRRSRAFRTSRDRDASFSDGGGDDLGRSRRFVVENLWGADLRDRRRDGRDRSREGRGTLVERVHVDRRRLALRQRCVWQGLRGWSVWEPRRGLLVLRVRVQRRLGHGRSRARSVQGRGGELRLRASRRGRLADLGELCGVALAEAASV